MIQLIELMIKWEEETNKYFYYTTIEDEFTSYVVVLNKSEEKMSLRYWFDPVYHKDWKKWEMLTTILKLNIKTMSFICLFY